MPASAQTPTSTPLKQQRSRKAAADVATQPPPSGRAGSAGGIVLEKETRKNMSSSTPKAAAGQPKEAAPAAAPSTGTATTKPRRKPRKLNKDPTPTSASTTAKPSTGTPSEPASELEALKSRIRSLESKVEDLYKTSTVRPDRSPRRRGKGRKSSSSNTTATLGGLAQAQSQSQALESRNAVAVDEEEADEELERLESELDGARRDLANYRPRSRRTVSDETDYVEEIPRRDAAEAPVDRQVTLSGSYRIPLPASVHIDDVKTIQSGVSAAQNVARRVLEQRRAAASSRQPAAAAGKGAGAGLEVVSEGGLGTEKKGWGEWIGGYSMAISRAVKSIEHEAAMEGQRSGGAAPKKTTRKRPAAKTAVSGEAVQGLMS